MSLIKLISADIFKLKRSLILLLLLSVPAMMMVVQITFIITGNASDQWTTFAMSSAAIWSFFLLPMTAPATTALLAQSEHSIRAWSYTLALPSPKWMVFLSKFILAFALMGLVSCLLYAAILTGGAAGGMMVPTEALVGSIPFVLLANLLFKMWLASFLVIAIQVFVALFFESFAIAIIFGISGTFVAMVATSAKMGVYFPWLLATNILASEPQRAVQALTTGLLGGILLAAFGAWALARRDWK